MTKQRILIVEDHSLLQMALRAILEEKGYETLTAETGIEALLVMKEAAPDLILSGICMPEMDGYAFCQKVKENVAWAEIPFIFLTATQGEEHVERAKALGVDAYMEKPFDPEELLLAIRSHLGLVKQ